MRVLSRFISGAILLALGLLLLRVSQPYVRSYRFEELLRQELRSATPRSDLSNLHRQVLEQARDMKFVVEDNDVQIERIEHGYRVDIRYSVPLDLGVYARSIEFQTTLNAVISEQSP